MYIYGRWYIPLDFLPVLQNPFIQFTNFINHFPNWLGPNP